MSPALRPGVTVGIALVGAGLIVVTPVTAPPPDIQARAVEFTASPVDPYVDLVTNTFDNLSTVVTHWLADPLPILVQAAVNWFGYAQTAIDSFTAAGQAFVDGLVNLPDQLQTLADAVTTGDLEEAFAELVIIALSIDPVPALLDRLAAIPEDIAGNFVSAVLATIHAVQVPIGLAAQNAAQATVAEVELVGQNFVNDLQDGDFTGALTQIIEAPAQIVNATLNSDAPGLAGLLAPFQSLEQTGFVDAVVNYLPRTVAHAIGALDAPIDDGPVADTATLFDVLP
jgi:hypothetical protein